MIKLTAYLYICLGGDDASNDDSYANHQRGNAPQVRRRPQPRRLRESAAPPRVWSASTSAWRRSPASPGRCPTGLAKRQGRPAVVDEQLLTGAVDLAHIAPLAASPGTVLLAGVGVAVRLVAMSRHVLRPQQLVGHAFASERLVDLEIVRYSATHWRRLGREQPYLYDHQPGHR